MMKKILLIVFFISMLSINGCSKEEYKSGVITEKYYTPAQLFDRERYFIDLNCLGNEFYQLEVSKDDFNKYDIGEVFEGNCKFQQ